MNRSKDVSCPDLQLFFDGDLDDETARRFEEHWKKCESCRNDMEKLSDLRNRLRTLASGRHISDACDLSIRKRIHQTVMQPETAPEIMDLEGVARFLNVPVSDLIPLLDTLPSFEIGGRLKFRREKILHWVESREMELTKGKAESDRKSRDRLILFPGGMV